MIRQKNRNLVQVSGFCIVESLRVSTYKIRVWLFDGENDKERYSFERSCES